METEKANPLLTLVQELESILEEDEGSSSKNNIIKEIIQTRQPHENEGRDLLSNLPDSLIHHIFSFLHFNDLVTFAAVSTRLRDISITSPTLSFSLKRRFHPQNNDTITCSSCTSFLSYITNLLHQRQSFPIHTLLFVCDTYNSVACTQHFQAHQQWIQHALTTCHVEELILRFPTKSFTNLKSAHPHPQWFFLLNSQCSLKSLVLELSIETLKLPEELTLPSLHTLVLEGIRVAASSHPIDEWVCKSFPNLKRLALTIIFGVTCLNIRSTCIESLTIENHGSLAFVKVHARNLRRFDFKTSSLCWMMEDEDLKMEIFAPNLEKLRWEGDARRVRWKGEMLGENLQDACFMINHYKKSSLVNIIQGVRCVKRLCVDSTILKLLLEDLNNLFENLRHLSVIVGFKREDAKYIFPFLERSPNLESLLIKEQDDFREASKSKLFNFSRDSKVLFL